MLLLCDIFRKVEKFRRYVIYFTFPEALIHERQFQHINVAEVKINVDGKFHDIQGLGKNK